MTWFGKAPADWHDERKRLIVMILALVVAFAVLVWLISDVVDFG